MIRVLSLWIAFHVLAAPAFAAVLRVPSQYATLKLASQAAVAEDTILIAPGTYDQLGQASTIRSGVCVISEEGREVTTLTGFGSGGLGFIHNPGVTTPSRLQGLTINAGSHAIRHFTVVEDNRIITVWRGAGGWWATLSSSCEFRGNIIEGDADRRFEMFPDPPAAVVWTFERNLIMQDDIFSSFGFIDGPVSQRLVLRNNTAVNFQGLDVGLQGQTSIEVVNNLFFGTGGEFGYAELWCSGFQHVSYDIRYNDWWNSQNLSCQYGVGNLFSNPMLCSPGTGDYRLHSSSPLIGAGENGTTIGAFGVGCGVTAGLPDDAESPRAGIRLEVSPNPVRARTEFRISGAAKPQALEIYDSAGRVVDIIEPGRAPYVWEPSSSVRPGVYFVRLRAAQGSATSKFVVLPR